MRQSCFFTRVRREGGPHEPFPLPLALVRLGCVFVSTVATVAFGNYQRAGRKGRNWTRDKWVDTFRFPLGERTVADATLLTVENGFSPCTWMEGNVAVFARGDGVDGGNVVRKIQSIRKERVKAIERESLPRGLFPGELLLVLFGDGTGGTWFRDADAILDRTINPIHAVDGNEERANRLPEEWDHGWKAWKKINHRWKGFEKAFRGLYSAWSAAFGEDSFVEWTERVDWFQNWIVGQLRVIAPEVFHTPTRNAFTLPEDATKTPGSKPDEEAFRRIDSENGRILAKIDAVAAEQEYVCYTRQVWGD